MNNCTYENCTEEATDTIEDTDGLKEYPICDFHAKFLNGEFDE